MTDATGSDVGEFALIRWIQQQAGVANGLIRGIGDDCAIDQLTAGKQLLTSTDLLIEDIHFKRQWTSMFDLGRKSAAVNISDIAAMGGVPRALFLGIGRSKQLEEKQLKDFIQGFLHEAQQFDAVLAGGDTCASPGPLIVAVTVQGHVQTGAAIQRDGARSGDAIYVSGTLGDSALALHFLESGRIPPAPLAQRLHTPRARVDIGSHLSEKGLATSMLDISDGLMADLNHLLTASRVGAEIRLAALPLSDAFRHELNKEPQLIDLALAGGEDYELLFTSARHDLEQYLSFRPGVVKIGTINAGGTVMIRQPDGRSYQCRRRGFDHFVDE
ncbi:MAG: thiamine-phosphate kinase [Pelovirga sp.]